MSATDASHRPLASSNMKIVHLFTILTIEIIFSTKIFGQPNCVYSHSWGFSAEQIELLDSNEFVYHYEDCTNSTIGYGRFEQTEKELQLFFRTVPPTINSNLKGIDSTRSILNECNISVRLLDENDKTTLQYGTIMILDSADHFIKGLKADQNGFVNLKLNPTHKLIKLKVAAMGYKTFILPMSLGYYDYQIEINMHSAVRVTYGNGDVKKYYIGKKAKDIIQLGQGDSKLIDYTITCR